MSAEGVQTSITNEEIRGYLERNPNAQIVVLDIDDTVLRQVGEEFYIINEKALVEALRGHVVYFASDSGSSKGSGDQELKRQFILSFVQKNNLISNPDCI